VRPKIIGVLWVAFIGQARAQTDLVRPEFEVASVKLNPGCHGGPRPGARAASRLVVPVKIQLPPGLLMLPCTSVLDLISSVYRPVADVGVGGSRPPQILGGPAWISTDYYQVQAKADAQTPQETLMGAMLLSDARG
jgi:uncharacterized protein (TIGR03435 family)